MGGIVNRGQNIAMPVGQTKADLPGLHSSNGRMPATCAIAPSSPCAMTRRLRRCFAKLKSHRIGDLKNESWQAEANRQSPTATC